MTMQVCPGTPKYGVWCSKCLLPGAIETPINFITPNGVVTLPHPIRKCIECERRQCQE